MNWKSREIRKPNKSKVEWLKIGEIGKPAVILGVLRNGSWVVDTCDGLIDLKDDKALTFVLPILNSSMYEFTNKIDNSKCSSEISNWIEFPLQELVVYAIEHGGGYWAEQALPLVLEINIKKESLKLVIQGLKYIEKDKFNDQKFRQKIFVYRNKFDDLLNTIE